MMKSKKFLGVAIIASLLASSCTEKYDYPFQNPNLTVEERTENLISLLTLEEKVSMMMKKTSMAMTGI